ncbi:hypothetical protein F511_15350 [Dorcoceras hygrometricum]|uniref:Uncharacterized protein n=1 Tax=Dorcoceras hygrometricum TaxID=472368 RepID=A0A2Z7A9Y5_9LAMI|nr:hypothetical protein F511_15350 [Dorcoceras hygrometricum]
MLCLSCAIAAVARTSPVQRSEMISVLEAASQAELTLESLVDHRKLRDDSSKLIQHVGLASWSACCPPASWSACCMFSVIKHNRKQSLIDGCNPALEGLTRSTRMDSPRKTDRSKFDQLAAAAAAFEKRREAVVRSRTPQNPLPMLNTLSSVSASESRIQYLFDPQWFRDTASRGPTTIVAPESQFRTCPTDHDSIGYPRMSASGESSTTMHRLLHASGSHPIPPPDDPKLIHSTNGNHLESPNEGSSIDHQVTIYLHAQNITMFPTNETWYFASQILVSSSGGLILILTAQSSRNVFRIHSDY